jgi:pantothenate synthetase
MVKLNGTNITKVYERKGRMRKSIIQPPFGGFLHEGKKTKISQQKRHEQAVIKRFYKKAQNPHLGVCLFLK